MHLHHHVKHVGNDVGTLRARRFAQQLPQERLRVFGIASGANAFHRVVASLQRLRTVRFGPRVGQDQSADLLRKSAPALERYVSSHRQSSQNTAPDSAALELAADEERRAFHRQALLIEPGLFPKTWKVRSDDEIVAAECLELRGEHPAVERKGVKKYDGSTSCICAHGRMPQTGYWPVGLQRDARGEEQRERMLERRFRAE